MWLNTVAKPQWMRQKKKKKRQLNDDRKNSAFGFLQSERKENSERWQQIMQTTWRKKVAAEMFLFLYFFIWKSSTMNVQREINIYVYVYSVHCEHSQRSNCCLVATYSLCRYRIMKKRKRCIDDGKKLVNRTKPTHSIPNDCHNLF